MKIAILTSGILPVPAVQGGAVENLIDFYLEYNNRKRLHDITVYSINSTNIKNHPALISDVNHYHYIDTTSFFAKIRRQIYKLFNKNEYYNYFIEYYFEQAYNDLKKQSFDCIIIENRPGYAKKLSKRINSKLVLHLHNDLLNNNTKYYDEIFKSIDRVLTVSDYIKSRVCTIKGTNKVLTIHNGIDLQRFRAQGNNIIDRKDLGLSPNDFILLFSGRINKDKGVSELIDALLLLKAYPNIKLLVIGSTFFGDANIDNRFTKLLKSRTEIISDRIKFTGFIPYSEMPNYLKLANLAVIPSIWDDPFPTTVLEAQAMGLPIITTKRGGIPEEVTKDNAILLETDKYFVKNLSKAILELFNNPEKCKQMSAVSIERSKMFDKETFAKNFFDTLENID